jgi:hypothetical protein
MRKTIILASVRPLVDSSGEPLDANFWSWFNQSKVVNAEGLPLRVYHATNAKFDKFNGSNRYYFAPSRKYVEREYLESGGRIIEAYLRIKNPDLVKRSEGEFLSAEQVQDFKDLGHDGYGIREVGGKTATEWVVFNPNQIRIIR